MILDQGRWLKLVCHLFFKFIVHGQVKSKLSKSKEEAKFSLNLLTNQDNNNSYLITTHLFWGTLFTNFLRCAGKCFIYHYNLTTGFKL